MERLTEKNNGNTPYNQTEYPYLAGADINDITNKLGKLEDIEQELGIQLEVLFKALKEGFYVRFVGLPARRLPEYSRFDFYNKKIDECNLKDYGKTWALTKEELE